MEQPGLLNSCLSPGPVSKARQCVSNGNTAVRARLRRNRQLPAAQAPRRPTLTSGARPVGTSTVLPCAQAKADFLMAPAHPRAMLTPDDMVPNPGGKQNTWCFLPRSRTSPSCSAGSVRLLGEKALSGWKSSHGPLSPLGADGRRAAWWLEGKAACRR